jgi:outer membrane immunogenic protein
MRLLALAAAATMLTAVPAMAQDVVADDQPFSGIYIGASGGYDVQPNDRNSGLLFDRNLDGTFGDTVTTTTGANAFGPGFCNGAARTQLSPANGGPCANDRNGFSYSGRVGFDVQRGPIVVGAVAEFGDTEITDQVSGFSTTPASYVLYRNIDWEGSVRGRLGFAANTTLFYGTFGAGYAKIDRAFASTNTANAYALTGEDKQFGILGGGGIEQKIGDNFSIGLEYMYHQYNDDDLRVRVSQGTQPATNPFVLAPNTTGTDIRRSDPKFRWSSLRATAAFRF